MADKNPKNNPPKSDERKLVEAGSLDLNDVEDQLALFWDKNKSTIIWGILAGIAVFLGFEGYRYLRDSADRRAQAAYAEAADADAKLEFAKSQQGAPLAGFAYKELADEAFASGDFAGAEAHYRQAVSSAESAVKDAAKMGLAMSLAAQGKAEEAKSILQEIARDPEAPSQGEAAYRLAVIASEAGDVETARERAASIDPGDFYWKSMAEALPGIDA